MKMSTRRLVLRLLTRAHLSCLPYVMCQMTNLQVCILLLEQPCGVGQTCSTQPCSSE